MLVRLLGARLHGWLDDAVVIAYLLGGYIMKLRAGAMGVAIIGAMVHFLLTRLTDYPQGYVRLIPFRVHAWIELAEGVAVILATWLLLRALPYVTLDQKVFLTLMGASQLVAFAISDYTWPKPGDGEAAPISSRSRR